MANYSESYLPIQKLVFPPDELLQITYPAEHWFIEGQDPQAHTRQLKLDRGFYMFKEWWQGRYAVFTEAIEENSQYCLYGLPLLERLIRDMHQKLAPQQKIVNKHLVFGLGATSLLNASLYATCLCHALQKHRRAPGASNPVNVDTLYVTQQLPAYLELQKNLSATLWQLATWVDFEHWQKVPKEKLVEFVTSLGNPTGQELFAQTKAHYVIYDRVNHMPMFYTDNPKRYAEITLENEWISIFSLSKFLGLSGSRVGYAFVEDEEIARYMRYFILLQTHGLAIDGQLKCIAALEYLFKENRLESYVSWYLQKLQIRWQQLKENLKDPKIQLCNTQASNAWIKIKNENAKLYLLNNYNILATYGPEYGVGEEFARFNLIGQQNEYNEMLYRLSCGPLDH